MKTGHLILLSFLLFIACGCDSDVYGVDIDLEQEQDSTNENLVHKGIYPIIAHRGAWAETGYPQNSLAALKEALSLDIFGSECDIWKTGDGIFVINHDKTYDWKDVTTTSYQELAKTPLPNGEPLPTLDDFLTAVETSPTQTKLVIELKSNAQPLEVFDTVYRRGLLHKVIFITYSYEKCKTFADLGCGSITYFIGHSRTPEEVKEDGIGGFYYVESEIRKEPDWVERSQAAGVQLVLGSVTNPTIMAQYIDRGCLFSSNKPITLVKAINQLEKEQLRNE